MVQIRKKMLCMIMMVLIIFTTVFVPVDCREAIFANTTEVYGDYEYLDGNDGVIITKYNGTSKTLLIPNEIKGKQVIAIGDDAFYKCETLELITFPNELKSIGSHAFGKCSKLKDVVLPENIETIGHGAFNSAYITSIVIPKSIRSMGLERGDYGGICSAFTDCKFLDTVIFEEGMTRIPDYALSGCKSVKNIVIPEGVTEIGEQAFQNTGIDTLNLPSTLEKIKEQSIMECGLLTSIVIPDNVKEIGRWAFSNCTELEYVKFPDNLRDIGSHAFGQCGKLKDVVLPENIETIGHGAFNSAYITSIVIPKSIRSMGLERGDYGGICSAFTDCKFLDTVIFEEGMTRIPDYVLDGCKNVANVVIPKKVTEIGVDAFRGCSNLKKIIIPQSVIKIEKQAFGECDNLSIYCFKDSYAYQYAVDQNIPYVIISDDTNIGDSTDVGNAAISCDKTQTIAEGTDAFIMLHIKADNQSEIDGIVNTLEVKNSNETVVNIEKENLGDTTTGFGESNLSTIWLFRIYGLEKGTATIEFCLKNGQKSICMIEVLKQNELVAARNSIVNETGYYGAKKYKETKAAEVQDAALEFKTAVNRYLDVLKGEIGSQGEIIDNKILGKKLRDEDEKANEKYITLENDNQINEKEKDKIYESVYCAFASFLNEKVCNAIDMGDIDFSKNSSQIATKIVYSVRNGMSGGVYETQYGKYKVTFNTMDMWGSYAGSVIVSKNGKNVCTGTITSKIDGTKKILITYIDELSKIVKDETKYALYQILSEYADVTEISKYSKEVIEAFLKDKADSLQGKGYGNILETFVNAHDIYNEIKIVTQATKGSSLESSLKKQQQMYEVVKSLDFLCKGINKKSVKYVMQDLEKARKKLEIKLFNKIYDQNEEYVEETWFSKIKNYICAEQKCPVDLEVYDSQGNLIGYVDSSDKYDDYVYYTDDIYIKVLGDTKKVYIPEGKEVSIKLIATDDGMMNYTLESVKDGEKIGRLNYCGISLVKGNTYNQKLTGGENLQNSKDTIALLSNEKTIYADEYLSASSNIAYATVNTKVSEGGAVIGDGQYPKGDSVVLTALLQDDNYRFVGWYNGEELVSMDSDYRFTITSNIVLKAVFQKKVIRDKSYETKMSEKYRESDIQVCESGDCERDILLKIQPTYNEQDLKIMTVTGYDKHGNLCYKKKIEPQKTGNYDFKVSKIPVKNICKLVICDAQDELMTTLIKNNENDGANNSSSASSGGGSSSSGGSSNTSAAESNSGENSSSSNDNIAPSENQNDDSAIKTPENQSTTQTVKYSIIVPSKKIAVGKKVKLIIKKEKNTLDSATIKWSSDNTKYATVNAHGVVIGKKKGIGKFVTITAKSIDGKKVLASVKIKIMKHAVTKVQIKAAPKIMKSGESAKLQTVVATNGKSANTTLKWKVSNTKYASVNKEGKVVAKKAGKTVIITAISTDGTNEKASVKIKIK